VTELEWAALARAVGFAGFSFTMAVFAALAVWDGAVNMKRAIMALGLFGALVGATTAVSALIFQPFKWITPTEATYINCAIVWLSFVALIAGLFRTRRI